jgi:hypothetical protein
MLSRGQMTMCNDPSGQCKQASHCRKAYDVWTTRNFAMICNGGTRQKSKDEEPGAPGPVIPQKIPYTIVAMGRVRTAVGRTERKV